MSVDTAAPSRAEVVSVAALALAGSALGSLALGRDFNVDLLQYHFYDGFALIAGRLDRDIAPAGLVSYFNPLLDAVHYLGITCLPPRVFGGLLGAFQGLNLLLVWAIGRRTLGRDGLWLAPLAALLAGLGQNAVSLLGTTFADTTVSVPVLAALLLLLGSGRLSAGRAFAASLLAGAAIGLKPTAGAALPGLAALVLAAAWRERRAGPLLASAAGGLSGWALADGWWALAMWRRFGNPFYPLFNNVFRSPFAPPIFRLDSRWRIEVPLDWATPPFDAALGAFRRLQEVPFRDARLLLPLLALLVWAAASVSRRRAKASLPPLPALAWFWLPSYALWLAVFHYYRYAAVLEILAPVAAFALLREAVPRRAWWWGAAVAVLLISTTSIGSWGRRPWEGPWFEPRVPTMARQPGQVVFLRDVALSFTAPFFPPDSRFVGVQAARGPAADEAIAALVRSHPGAFLMLARPPGDDDARVRGFGLHSSGHCAPGSFGAGQRVLVCPLAR